MESLDSSKCLSYLAQIAKMHHALGSSAAAESRSSAVCEEGMLHRLEVQGEGSGRSDLVRTCFLFHRQSICFALTLGKR